MMEGTAEQRGEKLNLGLSVKERMALFQKQSHPSQFQAKSVPTEAGISVRARTLGVPAASVRKEPAALSASSPVEKAAEHTEEPAPRVSIKDRINMLESAAKATSATSPRAPIDFPRPIVDRNPFPASHLAPPPKSQEPSFPIEQPKPESFRPGRVAEMTSKLSQSQGKAASKPLDIGVNTQEKKQLLQQFNKLESEKAKSELEGLPSLETRKSLLAGLKPTAEVRKDPVIVPGGSIQDRLNALNKPIEEGKKQTVEPMAESLAERKARIQQTLAAKMGTAQGGEVAIPIITAGTPAFCQSTASSTAVVAPNEVEKPTIPHTVLRKVADFDDFD